MTELAAYALEALRWRVFCDVSGTVRRCRGAMQPTRMTVPRSRRNTVQGVRAAEWCALAALDRLMWDQMGLASRFWPPQSSSGRPDRYIILQSYSSVGKSLAFSMI
jgi:hypothetical protein